MILIYAGVSKLLFRLKCQGGGSIVVYLDGRAVSETRNASLKDKQLSRGLKMTERALITDFCKRTRLDG